MGFEDVTAAIDAPVGIGPDDADALSRPADFMLNDGDEVSAGTVTLKAVFTPGHTPGSTCLYMGAHLFSGDTLFPGGPGKSGSPEKFAQLVESITTKLFPLGEDMYLYPGHGGDGDLRSSKEEYAVFASKEHTADLHGDVLWTERLKSPPRAHCRRTAAVAAPSSARYDAAPNLNAAAYSRCRRTG